MSDLVRSEVEAALEWLELTAYDGMTEAIPEPILSVMRAARAWLSTPTEPTDEPKRYYLCQHEDYESRKDCEQYGLDPVWDEGLDCRWVLIVEEASRAEETP